MSWWDVFWLSARVIALVVVAAVVAFAAGIAMAIWQANRLTAPLVYLAASAEQLGAGQVRPRLEPSGVEEIDLVAAELARSADRMAGRLAAERQFASDASHQLRTPLTALSMRLEEIMLATDEPAVSEEARISLEQVERLVRVVDDLLASSRRAQGGTTEAVRLLEVVHQQEEEWQPTFEANGRRLVVEVDRGHAGARDARGARPGASPRSSRTRCEHGAGTTTVRSRPGGPSGAVVVEVADEGAGRARRPGAPDLRARGDVRQGHGPRARARPRPGVRRRWSARARAAPARGVRAVPVGRAGVAAAGRRAAAGRGGVRAGRTAAGAECRRRSGTRRPQTPSTRTDLLAHHAAGERSPCTGSRPRRRATPGARPPRSRTCCATVPGRPPGRRGLVRRPPERPAIVHLPDGDRPLDAVIAGDAEHHLGADVASRFGAQLPVPAQDHRRGRAAVAPGAPVARPGPRRLRARRTRPGSPIDAPERSYRDANHKPELVYALTRLDAMVGFRAPRRAAELLADLDAPLAADLHALLDDRPHARTGPHGVRVAPAPADPARAPRDVAKFAEACARRLADGSPSPRTDRTVMRLAAAYPGDPGAVTSVLLNPVTLRPGEALFVPAGAVHAYLRGVGVEIMANSDNVLRAGLTGKHVDVDELLRNVDCVAAPPIRIAPERVFTSTEIYYAPVDDFELSVTRLSDDGPTQIPGRGPRVLVCLEGEVEVLDAARRRVPAHAGPVGVRAARRTGSLTATGDGVLVQADVP